MRAPTRCKSRGCLRVCPQTSTFLQGTCLFVIFGLTVVLIYGRSLPAVLFGIVGIVFSLEAIYAAGRRDLCMLKVYFAYLLCQSIFAVVFGSYVLSGADHSCAGTPNADACTSTRVMFALMLILGSSSIGGVAAVNTLFVLLAMRNEKAKVAEDAVKLAL